MTDDRALDGLPPKLQSYWQKARAFVTENQVQWESISPGTPEFYAWVKYFQNLGVKPHMLTLVEYRQIQTIAVPTKFPEWFDPNHK
jgi:hypothetical protein